MSAIVRLMATTRAIELRTVLPGPSSQSLLERKERVIAGPLSLTFPIAVQEAQGALLTDVDGNTFIDFTGGVGCLNVGHSHPRVVAAAQEQLESFAHTDFTIVPYESYVTLAERLIEAAPFTGPAKAAFFNAGTEAVENSIKFARAFTGRPAVIVFEGAFHGRTLLSMTMTSKTHPYKAGLGPFAPEVYRVPFANDYRGPSATDALASLARAPPDLRRARDRPRRRRGADGLRPHRQVLRHRALRHRARPADRGEVDRRRPAALRRDRQGGDHGRAGRLGDRGHLRRQSGCAGRGARRPRRV